MSQTYTTKGTSTLNESLSQLPIMKHFQLAKTEMNAPASMKLKKVQTKDLIAFFKKET